MCVLKWCDSADTQSPIKCSFPEDDDEKAAGQNKKEGAFTGTSFPRVYILSDCLFPKMRANDRNSSANERDVGAGNDTNNR